MTPFQFILAILILSICVLWLPAWIAAVSASKHLGSGCSHRCYVEDIVRISTHNVQCRCHRCGVILKALAPLKISAEWDRKNPVQFTPTWDAQHGSMPDHLKPKTR